METSINHSVKLIKGFTLVELMVTIAIAGILGTVALPSLNNFLVVMRVDNEMTEMQRLLLTARNSAINTGLNTTVCPLDSNSTCTDDWENDISVFTNTAGTNEVMDANDIVIKIKSAIKDTDQLEFSSSDAIIYTPEGRTLTNTEKRFIYCPGNYSEESNGIVVSTSGRAYMGTRNSSNKYVDRSDVLFTCS